MMIHTDPLGAPSARGDHQTVWSAEDVAAIQDAAVAWSQRDRQGDASEELYRRWYSLTPSTGAQAWDERWAPVSRVLREAHAGTDLWLAATPVVAVGHAGTVVTAKNGKRRAHPRGDYITVADCPGLEPVVGTLVRPRARGGCHVVDGWWRTWGGGWRPTTDEAEDAPNPYSRLYIKPDAQRIVPLIHRITQVLIADEKLRWQIKAAAHPESLNRPDAIVVYLGDDDFEVLKPRLTAAVEGCVRAGRPPLTASLGPGLGWAQDPGGGISFGERCCQTLAAAFAVMPREGDPLRAVTEEFRRVGLRPEAPHLRAEQAV